jgi:hypothetical protein
LEDRRQAACEAGNDTLGDAAVCTYSRAYAALDDAIETATRVQVTDEIIAAAWPLTEPYQEPHKRLVAAFRAAGFEVVE